MLKEKRPAFRRMMLYHQTRWGSSSEGQKIYIFLGLRNHPGQLVLSQSEKDLRSKWSCVSESKADDGFSLAVEQRTSPSGDFQEEVSKNQKLLPKCETVNTRVSSTPRAPAQFALASANITSRRSTVNLQKRYTIVKNRRVRKSAMTLFLADWSTESGPNCCFCLLKFCFLIEG